MEYNHPIYLDNSSTSKTDKRVLECMLPYFDVYFGNPSSLNSHSIEPKKAIIKSREQVANLLSSNSDQIIFNSGSTEGINHVLKSLFFSSITKGKNHLIVSTIEHKAVLETAKYLETIGCEVTYLNVDENGIVDLNHLSQSLSNKTFLTSVMLVNNETGVIQPLREIVTLSHAKGVPVFTDATQAIGKISVDVNILGVDYLCLSAHKIYGPKGVGALFSRNPDSLIPFFHGGNQENGLRGGTYNVPGIVGLGEASRISIEEMSSRYHRYQELKAKIFNDFIGTDGYENFKNVNKVPNIISISLSSENNIEYLNRKKLEFSASTGSACNASLIQDSHVLKAIPGINPKKVIRISL